MSAVSNPYARDVRKRSSSVFTWCMALSVVFLLLTSRGYHHRKERRAVRTAHKATIAAQKAIPKGIEVTNGNVAVNAPPVVVVDPTKTPLNSQLPVDTNNEEDDDDDDDDDMDWDPWNPLSLTDTLGAAAESAGDWFHQTAASILGEDLVHSAGELIDSGLDSLGDWPDWINDDVDDNDETNAFLAEPDNFGDDDDDEDSNDEEESKDESDATDNKSSSNKDAVEPEEEKKSDADADKSSSKDEVVEPEQKKKSDDADGKSSSSDESNKENVAPPEPAEENNLTEVDSENAAPPQPDTTTNNAVTYVKLEQKQDTTAPRPQPDDTTTTTTKNNAMTYLELEQQQDTTAPRPQPDDTTTTKNKPMTYLELEQQQDTTTNEE